MRLCDIPRDAKYFIVSEESYSSDSYDSISFYLSFQFFKDKESFEAAVLAITIGNSNEYKKPFKCGSIQLAEVHTEVRVDIK